MLQEPSSWSDAEKLWMWEVKGHERENAMSPTTPMTCHERENAT